MTENIAEHGVAEKKVAVISGGTSGIGRAIATRLAEKGHFVVAFGNDAFQAEQTSAALASRGLCVDILEADVSNTDDIAGVVKKAVSNYGKIDYLCNCAGIRPVGTILETEEETWDLVMQVNLKGMFLLTKAVIPHMIRNGGGAIVNISSTSGFAGKSHFAYSVSKGAIATFTRSLAIDYVDHNIRVNTVVPGFIQTGMTQNWPDEAIQRIAQKSLLKRAGVPEDIAGTVLFLLSDEALTITGTTIEVGTLPGSVPGR
ncbi:MAG: short-chain dehydrogenase [Noviherbaspirillum sp.]|nr:short-chain dehydrogenase [Noviherbaspirillum sp.]